MEFFSRYMSLKQEDECFYNMTNAISHIWLSENDLSGIAFPNINSSYYEMDDKLLGLNIVMKPQEVDRLYRVDKVWILKFTVQSILLDIKKEPDLSSPDTLR